VGAIEPATAAIINASGMSLQILFFMLIAPVGLSPPSYQSASLLAFVIAIMK